jgi:hypothetical protein
MNEAPKLTITEASGRMVSGVVQGCGGAAWLTSVERAIQNATAGDPTMIYEPEPGHCHVFERYAAHAQGPRTLVDLRGATARAATAREAVTDRFRSYCVAHGFAGNPDGMFAHDRERWPGGRMCGFMIWIRQRWRAWDAQRPESFSRNGPWRTDKEHVAFDAWLSAAFPEPAGEEPGGRCGDQGACQLGLFSEASWSR